MNQAVLGEVSGAQQDTTSSFDYDYELMCETVLETLSYRTPNRGLFGSSTYVPRRALASNSTTTL